MKHALFVLVFAGFALALAAQGNTINLYVDTIRFPQADGTTRIEINYKIPYPSVTFVPGEYGYEATVDVEIQVLRIDGYRTIKTFTNKILTANPNDPAFATRYYLDKISLNLTSELTMRLRFIDTMSDATTEWEKKLTLLPPEQRLSELELASSVQTDTTRYLEKFHRGDRLFTVQPDHVFTSVQADTVWVYAEYIADMDEAGEAAPISLTLTGNDLDRSMPGYEITLQPGFNEILLPLRLVDLREGHYTLRLDLYPPNKQPLTHETYVLRREPKVGIWRLFDNMDDEKLLLSYFVPKSELRAWDNLTNGGRLNFLDRFWTSHDPTPETDTNEFFTLVQERIRFANEQYSKYQPGWMTDRGRIYIRLGTPDSIEKDTTASSSPVGDDALHPSAGMMGARDYQIWKYYQDGTNRSYLFFDKHTSGDLRLIHAINDDYEVGDPNWEYLMGSNFDESDME